MELTLNIHALKALSCFCDVSEVRFYLKGVHVERDETGVIMVATDGHVLSAVRQASAEWPVDNPAPFIVPLTLLKRIKIDKRIELGTVKVKDKMVIIEYAGSVIAEPVIDGVFPHWSHVVPKDPANGELAQFNPEKLGQFVKAAKVWFPKSVTISHNGQSPALVNWFEEREGCEGFGLIMPLRSTNTMTIAPTWARELAK